MARTRGSDCLKFGLKEETENAMQWSQRQRSLGLLLPLRDRIPMSDSPRADSR